MNVSRRHALLALSVGIGNAGAQPVPAGPPKRIALLTAGSAEDSQSIADDLSAALTSLGWQPGRTVLIERAYAGGNAERLRILAEELAGKKLDVIVTGSDASTLPAVRATRTTPIVFISVHYPVEVGLADSYARPGGNVTGPALYTLDLLSKPLDFLREIAPTATKLAVVYPRDLVELPTASGPRKDLRPIVAAAARGLGFDAQFHFVPARVELDAMFKAIASSGTEVLLGGIPGAPQPLTEFALRERMPAAYPLRYFAEAGGLLSYGPVDAELRRAPERAARYVDHVLRGASPGELAIDQPSRYELTLNSGTARAMGLVLPRSLVLRADAVIG